ncbi:MAG TPA: 3'-5' exonuclease, partial [Acinetobacter junii]|nr:3'-5' exonuclease [Acinetobacter junii]
MNLRFPILVFDIETLTDLKAGAHLYHLDLTDHDVEQALT